MHSKVLVSLSVLLSEALTSTLSSVPRHSNNTWIVSRHEARHTKLLEHCETSVTKFVYKLWQGEFCQYLLMATV